MANLFWSGQSFTAGVATPLSSTSPVAPSVHPVTPDLFSALLILLGIFGVAIYAVKKLKFRHAKLAMPVLFSFLVLASAAHASNDYWHTSDYYEVQLNGVGNAFVVNTIGLQSLTATPVNSITLQIPYTGITIYTSPTGL